MKSCWREIGIALSLTLLLFGCSSKTVKGNGQQVTKTRQVSSFEQIAVNGAYKLDIVQGDRQSLQITTDSNIQPLVITQEKNGILIIHNKLGVSFYLLKPVLIKITVVNLNHIVCSGYNEVKLTNFHGDQLKIQSGLLGTTGANISTAADVANVVGTNGKDGDLSLILNVSGVVKEFVMDLSGSVNVIADKLEAKQINVYLRGSGIFDLNVSDAIKVNAVGSANVTYQGALSSVDFLVVGSGKFLRKKINPLATPDDHL